MKVVIKSEEAKIFLILPTSLILNKLSAAIATKILKSKIPAVDLSTDELMKLINCIKRYKKNHKHWEVVNISSADGEIVFISL